MERYFLDRTIKGHALLVKFLQASYVILGDIDDKFLGHISGGDQQFLRLRTFHHNRANVIYIIGVYLNGILLYLIFGQLHRKQIKVY